MKAIWRAAVLGLAALWLAAGEAPAAEVRVMNSGGFSAAYLALAPAFETATGNTLVIIWGPSMGTAPEAIPNRLARGEAADVVIMVGSAPAPGSVIENPLRIRPSSRGSNHFSRCSSRPDDSMPMASSSAFPESGALLPNTTGP